MPTLLIVAISLGILYWGYTEETGSDPLGILGSKLSADQIATYASNAGFSGDDLSTAVAIALAESGGKTSVKGDLSLAPDNGPSIGLWQINIGSKAHPEYAGLDLTDPQNNANAAFSIYSVSGFNAWTTYNSGAYAEFLGTTDAATGNTSDQSADLTDDTGEYDG